MIVIIVIFSGVLIRNSSSGSYGRKYTNPVRHVDCIGLGKNTLKNISFRYFKKECKFHIIVLLHIRYKPLYIIFFYSEPQLVKIT